MGWRARPSPPSKEEVQVGGPFEFVRGGGKLEKEGDEKWKLMPRNSGLCVSKLVRRTMGVPTGKDGGGTHKD